jgi:DNA-binding transcriptional regulator YhcF (GntR family)
MIESGDLAKLEGSAIKVYLAIKAHVNFSNGRSFPSIELIAKEAGLSVAQVKRSLTSLEELSYLRKTKEGRKNIYALSEKIALYEGETQTGIATWDYVPSTIKHAVNDLKNVLLTGDFAGARIVHIERLVLQTQIVTGDHNVSVQAGQEALERLAEKTPELAAALLSIKERQEIKKG